MQDSPAVSGTAAPTQAAHRAIIDIGSNTVRLVIYDGPPRAPMVLHNEKVSARLGKAVVERGVLSEKAQTAALTALARYRCLLDLRGVTRVDVAATAAVRDAANGADFLARVAELGFAPRLLSGEEEAETSAKGVIGAFPGAAGVVADLGGGSLELVDVANGACSHGVSLPLGTLRLPPLRAGGARGFRRHVRASLAEAQWSAAPGQTLYLVGGSFRAFARWVLEQDHAPSDDPHGFAMAAARAALVARTLTRRKGAALNPVPGIAAPRLAALPDTAALLLALIEAIQPQRLVFSAWGLREGLLYASLPEGAQRQDPLLAGVADFVQQHGTDAATATMVAGWATAASAPPSAGQPTPPASPAEPASGGTERLRLAATMLALAAATVEPNLRADLAVSWAMRKRWIGITNRERAMLAAALMASSARFDLPAAWRISASTDDLRQAQAWGLGARLCRRFSGCSPRSLSESALLHEPGQLVLAVRPPYDVLLNEGVERDLRALGGLLGLRTAVRVGD